VSIWARHWTRYNEERCRVWLDIGPIKAQNGSYSVGLIDGPFRSGSTKPGYFILGMSCSMHLTALTMWSFFVHRYLSLTKSECRFKLTIYSVLVAPLPGNRMHYLRIRLIIDKVLLQLDPQLRSQIFLCFVVWVYYRTACSGPPLQYPPPLHRYYLTLPLFRFFMLLWFILTVLSNLARTVSRTQRVLLGSKCNRVGKSHFWRSFCWGVWGCNHVGEWCVDVLQRQPREVLRFPLRCFWMDVPQCWLVNI
jgi:hypothetical protein